MANRGTGGRAQVGTLEVGGVRVLRRQLQVPITNVPTTEVDSGLDLPANAVVHDAWLIVSNAVTSAGATLNAGLLSTEGGGNVSGFIAGISTTSTGVQRPAPASATSGSLGRFLTTNNYGPFISIFSSGSTAAGESGMFVRRSYPVSSTDARSVSYAPESTGWLTFRGTIVLDFSTITT